MTEKKSTYNAAAQKKYNEKRLAAVVMNDGYEKIHAHMSKKGFTSVNSYLLHLIHEDMKQAEND